MLLFANTKHTVVFWENNLEKHQQCTCWIFNKTFSSVIFSLITMLIDCIWLSEEIEWIKYFSNREQKHLAVIRFLMHWTKSSRLGACVSVYRATVSEGFLVWPPRLAVFRCNDAERNFTFFWLGGNQHCACLEQNKKKNINQAGKHARLYGVQIRGRSKACPIPIKLCFRINWSSTYSEKNRLREWERKRKLQKVK